MYQRTALNNGLRIVTHNMKERDSLAIGIWVGVGGRYESDPIKGAAHFIEHIVFKGSRKYSCEQIKELIEGVGGALNAFTSEEQTCYYAKIPSKYIQQTADILIDMTFQPKIKKADVSKESTVIIEEIKMYHDLPQHLVMELLDSLVWPNHPLGKSLAGSPETISSMKARDLSHFHQLHYNPENVVIAACGNLVHKDMVKLVSERVNKLPKASKVDFLPVEKSQTQPRLKLHKKDIEQMHLALGMPGYDERHKDRYVLSLLSIILGGNMSSRLFVEVREKRGLAYSISSSTKTLHDTGMFMVRAGVDNQKIIGALDLILKELNKIKNKGVSSNEFLRAKDYLLGQLLLGLEDTLDHMLWLGEALISKDEMRTLKDVMEEFAKIKKNDIQRVAKEILDQKRYNLAIVGPLSERQDKEIAALMG